uniref:DNA-directed RNA polymerase subunit n=1 Tax=Euglena anabaena TaxID=38273 RepID=A0A0G3F9G6_EUGAN|nr:RNA polymerase beta' subunit [Euglenaria anabaena]AKJ83330.1 RNA polymerase beta' subunit [Euglenaria anabaena]
MIREYVTIKIASPKKILSWTERMLPNGKFVGKITKSETVDNETFKPIFAGLFCEQIFGPTISWECFCKKYKKIQLKTKNKSKIIICPKCNVEITDKKIRNYRMGNINLAAPVTHIWYLRNNPSYISILINKSIKQTNNINSGKSYILIKNKKKEIWLTGGEAIKTLLEKINLEQRFEKTLNFLIKVNTEKDSIEKKRKGYKNRLKLINHFIQTKTNPSWMTLKYLPVLPPNLRPILKLQDKTIITTDLNFLYAKIIEINNKIIKLRKMSVTENFLNNEKKLLQDTVDKLINNEKNTKNLILQSKKPLKSLSKIIQGKKGRFRENLLGKTVDYSGRSVIIVEPKLKLNECGIPLKMVVELFQPFLIKKLLKLKKITTIKEGKEIIKKDTLLVQKILEKITPNLRILLNRAPTLHRVGIQAFQPKIIDGKAIQLHPLVCSAFNADFDGDQMGVHIPLSLKTQAEARTLMISPNNCTSPATGQANIVPSQDMVLGYYFLTIENTSLFYILKKIKYFNNTKKVMDQYNLNNIEIHDYIWITLEDKKNKRTKTKKKSRKCQINRKNNLNRTTPGRIIFNNAINEFL